MAVLVCARTLAQADMPPPGIELENMPEQGLRRSSRRTRASALAEESEDDADVGGRRTSGRKRSAPERLSPTLGGRVPGRGR